MLGKLGGDRVRHYLAAVDLSRLASVNCGMPTRLGIAVNGHLEIACADPLLHDLFKFGCRLLLLIQRSRSLFVFAFSPISVSRRTPGVDYWDNQASGCPCKRASSRLPGIPKVRRGFEGRSDLASYLNAKSRRRRFMNGSAFSASVRQRSACSLKNELSIFDSNAAHYLGTALDRAPSVLA